MPVCGMENTFRRIRPVVAKGTKRQSPYGDAD